MSLSQQYKESIRQSLQQELKLDSIMEVPRLEKIILNMGVGEAILDKKVLDNAVRDMTLIAGQKPIITNAKKSVASFKVRAGWPLGCKVTLRGERMWEFLERLIHIAIPRVRDFRGLNVRSFDGHGNYNIGIKEQIVFPEIDYDKIDKIRGLDIAVVTTSNDDKHALALLKALRFPFRVKTTD